MSENEKKNGTWRKLSRVAKISIILLVVATISLGVALGKYVWERISGNAEMTSDAFYFTVDLLGDSEMIEAETGHYSFADSQSGTWNLYSGTKHTVTFKVQNFADELRVTKSAIKYTATVTAASPNGTAITIDGLTLKNGETDIKGVEQTINAASDGKGVTHTLALSIPAHSDSNAYEDGTKVTVTIKSSSPYEKIIKLDFVLHTMETGLFYKIIDAPNNPYAELVLINALSEKAQPTIKWCSGLSIDNTNMLTYTKGENGSFIQQAGIESREMQISRELGLRESVSIHFFKEDQTKDYTVEQTEVVKSGGTFTIEINEPSNTNQPSTNT